MTSIFAHYTLYSTQTMHTVKEAKWQMLYLLHTRSTINSIHDTCRCHDRGWLRHSGCKLVIRCESVADADNHVSQAEHSRSNCPSKLLTAAQRRSSAARRQKYATVSSDQHVHITHMKLCWQNNNVVILNNADKYLQQKQCSVQVWDNCNFTALPLFFWHL